MLDELRGLGGALRLLGGVLALTGLAHVLVTFGFFTVKGVPHGLLSFSLAGGLLQSMLGISLFRAGRRLRKSDVDALSDTIRPLYGLGILLFFALGTFVVSEAVLCLIATLPSFGGC